MPARWSDHVSTVPPNVQPGSEPPTGVIAEGSAGMSEVEMPSPAPGADGATFRERAVRGLQPAQAVLTPVVGVDVQDDEAAGTTSTNSDVGGGPPSPPRPDLPMIARRTVETVLDPRVLADGPALGLPAATAPGHRGMVAR